MNKLKIGTRGSALALKQAEITEAALAAAFPELEVERVIITTTGDRRTDVALSEVAKVEGVWDKGVFIKELEIALENGEIDVAVHSLKDLPTVLEDQFELAGVLERAPVRDAFIGKVSWEELGQGSVVGTSSARRAQQLVDLKPGVEVCDLRGNVPTRLRKAAEGEMDGIILAEAGLRRLGYSVEGSLEIEGHVLSVQCLPEREFFPAAGQGAVGYEIRSNDCESRAIIAALNHDDTWARITAERRFLELLSAGCNTPVGVWSEITGDEIKMGARVYPETGGEPQRAEVSAAPGEVAELLFNEL
ncbi:hydroxymethylbilane synthase [Akkermansiaceae bacterium]|nr:hydroxymethylbilane synthase [Akkermansiaceae bacterium]MDB4411142.1 hydroxymethylbilane synthase [bacterium]MDA8968537.1 hydroxymethylbilane synthase [Akkermansiaceae bacterium]MDB4272722.1 hydroxymethylbilane synthase [Akkermansiaceae bacterium]MDB4283191.1 hydroxymethylbilane synthase [Akkermansiaceae bacterium]